MFSSNKGKETGRSTTGTAGSVKGGFNSLVQGTQVEGDIRSKNDIRIDGKIKGSLNCESKVVVGPTGAIEGEVHCQNAVLEGKFEGKLTVSGLLTIQEKANVQGEIRYGRLVVQPGATLIGDVRLIGSVKVNTPGKDKTGKSATHAGDQSAKAGEKGKAAEKEAASR